MNITDMIRDFLVFNNAKVDELIKNSRLIREKIVRLSDAKMIIRLLLEDTFSYNTYKSVLYFLSSVSPDRRILEAEHKLENYNYEFNSDIKLYDKLTDLPEYTNYKALTDQEKIFISRFIKSMHRHGINKKNSGNILKLLENIDSTERYLADSQLEPIVVNLKNGILSRNSDLLMSALNTDTQKRKDRVSVTSNTYFQILKLITDPAIRANIEKIYFEKDLEYLPKYVELILSRYHYAKSIDYTSYFNLLTQKTQDESDSIRELMNDLISRIDSNVRKELQNVRMLLHADGRKLGIHDIIHVIGKMTPKSKFKPNDIVATLVMVAKKYFNLRFESSKNQKHRLNSNFNTLECYHKSVLRGHLHLDLIKRDKKLPQSIICIGFNERFLNQETNEIITPNICLLASFQDMNTECMSFRDVINTFKAFGDVLERLIYDTEIGMLNNDHEFTNFFSQIMEYLLYDDYVLNMLCKNKQNVEALKRVRDIDLCFSLKMKSVNAIFDHLIHNSADIIKILSTEDNKVIVINELYKKVYFELFEPMKSILDININGINPSILNSIVTGGQGVLYGNIISDIMAYNAYLLLNRGKGDRFIKILSSAISPFKRSIKRFISELDIDYYQNYLKNYLNVDIKDIAIDTDANYYEESEEDEDEIINIER